MTPCAALAMTRLPNPAANACAANNANANNNNRPRPRVDDLAR